ncbi:MAG: class I SAM-dependent methyltransferase, partial [Bacteroidota bacterium]
MEQPEDYLDVNRASWNQRTDHHLRSEFYDVEGFIHGKTSLNSIELDLLGDVAGTDVLHLQCHFGQDSLSLARMGARVVGVDLSDRAIEAARDLNDRMQLNAQFVQSDVYGLDERLDRKFDTVFTTYGVLGWLPDMDRWAKVVDHFLKPGGRLILAEFHPVVWMYDDQFQRIDYSYFNRAVIRETETGTYTDTKATFEAEYVSWNHGLGEVLGSLLQRGLTIRDFKEYDYSPYDCFTPTVEVGERQFRIKHLDARIPMVYSVVAQKG